MNWKENSQCNETQTWQDFVGSLEKKIRNIVRKVEYKRKDVLIFRINWVNSECSHACLLVVNIIISYNILRVTKCSCTNTPFLVHAGNDLVRGAKRFLVQTHMIFQFTQQTIV